MIRGLGAIVMAAGVVLAGVCGVSAEVCNIKVVTDRSPDYHDMRSMIRSVTGKWPTMKEKCWAMYYWNHIARRQTAPMAQHGLSVTDPIRQFNDYGYMMCSTIAGSNCAIWHHMGLKVKFWDITAHTVSECEYDGRFHVYDNSLSGLYTLCDGVTIAGVEDVGKKGACKLSGGKAEPGHIAKYHCLTATSIKGFLHGADTQRSLDQEYRCFNPNGLKFRYYYNNWDWGHRYILNLRKGEVYTRYYHRLDANSPNAVVQASKRPNYKADPAYYVPNRGKDPESVNPRYRIRGNGIRTFKPSLTTTEVAAHQVTGLKTLDPAGLAPVKAGEPGVAVFKIEGANVITSLTLDANFFRKTQADLNKIAVSTTNGLTWTDIWQNRGVGETPVKIKLIEEVNGAYEVLLRVELTGKDAADDAQLRYIAFKTVTTLNSKTQPMLKLGKNTVYVGTGRPTGSIVFWPELQNDAYKPYVVEEKNMTSARKHIGYQGTLFARKPNEDAWVVFKVDSPNDVTRIVYGGRLYNRAAKAHIDFLHSFDGGKTWQKPYSLTDIKPPWDVIHYETVDQVPDGTRSVLFKYLLNASAVGASSCSIYAVRMEVNHKVADPGFKPMEVTFTWDERQEDYSTIERSHTQLVEKVPFKYAIGVGGADHPVVKSLRVNLKDAVKDVTYGYSDGKEVDGRKFVDRWVTYGRNYAEGKPYTVSVPTGGNWGSTDPEGRKLTDGVVGPPYAGGSTYASHLSWGRNTRPEIVVDLREPVKAGAFRINVSGYPWWDAVRGQFKDKTEVLVSLDGEEFTDVGAFDFNLRWKDVPANRMWPDAESFCAESFELIPEKPVECRYVKIKLTPARIMCLSEVQVFDKIKYTPFDLRIALPDGD